MPLIILQAVGLAANCTGLHIMYFNVMHIKVLFIGKHLITLLTLMITPVGYVSLLIKNYTAKTQQGTYNKKKQQHHLST